MESWYYMLKYNENKRKNLTLQEKCGNIFILNPGSETGGGTQP